MNWNSLEIEGLRLELTCPACPEQYDVYQNGKQIAYFRLRHGSFTAKSPDARGSLIYQSESVSGDGLFDDSERTIELSKACLVVKAHLLGMPAHSFNLLK